MYAITLTAFLLLPATISAISILPKCAQFSMALEIYGQAVLTLTEMSYAPPNFSKIHSMELPAAATFLTAKLSSLPRFRNPATASAISIGIKCAQFHMALEVNGQAVKTFMEMSTATALYSEILPMELPAPA